MRLPDMRITLVSLGIDNIETMKLSIDDARIIFRIDQGAHATCIKSKKSAQGSLFWKTDARGQDTIVIWFDGPLGSTRAVVDRESATVAVIEFTRKFGLD